MAWGAGEAQGAGSPIFIVGCPRSGTTLLRQMIDAHSQLSCGPETQYLSDFQRIEREHWERLSRFGVPLDEWHESVASFFSELHRRFADAQGKSRWVDKSPNYALILDYVDALFPDALVLHIIRDGRDVVASYEQRWGARSARGAPRAWRRHIEAARAWGSEHPQRYHEVRYERLVGDPAATMRGVLDFLGEPWEDGVLDFAATPRPGVLEPRARDGVYTSSVGRGRDLANAVGRLRLRFTAGRLMAELGYS